MDPYIFGHLINSLQKDATPLHKMYIMKITIGNAGAISKSQLVQLLQFLPNDDDKLEMAKMAYGYVIDQYSYDYVTDPEGYSDVVGAAFSFDVTKAMLDEYVHRRY